VRQDAGVEHVGIAEHEVRACPDRPAGILRRIAVIREHANPIARLGLPRGLSRVRGERLADRLQLSELILRERLGWKQIQRAARRILQDVVKDGRVVAERLARCRRRDDHDVAARQRVLDRLRLMCVQLGDAAGDEGAAQPVVESSRKRRKLRRHGRKTPECRHVQIRSVGPPGYLAGRQAVQRIVERAITPRSRDQAAAFGQFALGHW
jgi:hypothetical protein